MIKNKKKNINEMFDPGKKKPKPKTHTRNTIINM